jgi:1-aminocyclopropane-1-carboxylate deaminase/D-cysteine desulfhydrase-like pyridoxal-dependent ACC family enzyme
MSDAGSIEVADQYAGEGFGLLDGPTKEAVQRVARTEGIVLDPTYSGKGFAGLMDYIRQGRLEKGEDVVFVHTGGTPLVFVYGDMLL